VTGKRKPVRRTGNSLQQLQDRLDTAEETLRALRAGDVDALVVAGAGGAQVQTLAGADIAYIVLFDQMNEGAVTLTRDGVIAYANRRFAEIVRTDLPGAEIDSAGLYIAYDLAYRVRDRVTVKSQLSYGSRDGAAHFGGGLGTAVDF